MTKRKLPLLPIAAAAALAFSPALVAQTSGSGYMGTSQSDQTPTKDKDKTPNDMKGMNMSGEKVSGADRSFAIKAARDGMAEVELGRLAADKASSEEVKNLAKKVVDDHTKANDELKTIAASKGITLPTETDRSHKAKMSKLQNLSGNEFDKAFVSDMLKDHEKDMKLFQKEADKGKDADLKSFAQKTVPTLHEHHESIDNVAASIGVKTRKGTLPAAGKTNDMSKDKSKSDSGTSSNPNPMP